jgi:diguanylate cyclase (GGDEF)-like protein
MNLSPSAVLVIVVVVAVTNILIVLAVVARSRAQRARQYAEVDALLGAPTWDDGRWDDTPAPIDTWLPSTEHWPTAVQQLSGASDGWPMSGALGAAGARRADPADVMQPFAFPAPTPLEQRSAAVDDASDEDDATDEDDADYEDADDDEGDVDVNGTEMQFDEADEDEAAEDESQDTEDQAEAESEAEPEAEAEAEVVPAAASVATNGSRQARFGRDGLTGLLDAVAFEEAMSQEEAREQRYGHPATVIVFELDGLAKLVDRLGPEPGDRIETALGDAIKRLARRADYVARLERGRYAALLPVTDEVAAINYVERIRRACDLWLESGAIAMRLAIGWASTNGDAGLTGAVRVATDRMRGEQRRNARGVGDETAGVDELDASQPAEAAAAI